MAITLQRTEVVTPVKVIDEMRVVKVTANIEYGTTVAGKWVRSKIKQIEIPVADISEAVEAALSNKLDVPPTPEAMTVLQARKVK